MLWAGGSMLLTVGIVAGLILMVKHEPTFYRRAEVPAGKERNDLAHFFVGRFADLVGNWVDVMKGPWEVTFTEKQINSYFEEDFIRLGEGELFRRQGISNPAHHPGQGCAAASLSLWQAALEHDHLL